MAKEIWDKLREIHEGSDTIREQKKSSQVVKYENFKMEFHENIDKMYYRFNDIIKNILIMKCLVKNILWMKEIEKFWILCLKIGKLRPRLLKRQKFWIPCQLNFLSIY